MPVATRAPPGPAVHSAWGGPPLLGASLDDPPLPVPVRVEAARTSARTGGGGASKSCTRNSRRWRRVAHALLCGPAASLPRSRPGGEPGKGLSAGPRRSKRRAFARAPAPRCRLRRAERRLRVSGTAGGWRRHGESPASCARGRALRIVASCPAVSHDSGSNAPRQRWNALLQRSTPDRVSHVAAWTIQVAGFLQFMSTAKFGERSR
jgi:hypothetical protein